MNRNTKLSFFARLRQKFFKWRFDREIFERIFTHHSGEKDYGYPFRTREEMNVLTTELDVQALLDTVEGQIRSMPDAYGESFRYLMHRDLYERLHVYEQLARRRVRRPCDPRFVATRLESAQ